jgi:hypothetical protein
MWRLKLPFVVSLAATLAVWNPTWASTPVQVSGATSLYAGCSDAGQNGTNYSNAEDEPFVAANPKTAGNLAGVYQQDRWSNGGAHGLVAAASFDGGGKWTETALPFSICAPGAVIDPFTNTPYDRASDPWISFGPDGTAYTVALAATETASGTNGNNDTAVAAATSADGGKTWGNTSLIKADQGTSPIFEVTQFFNDKESVTADPIHAGTAFVVWDRLQAPSHSPDADLRAHAFRGPTWFSKTTDGGKTWTGTRAIFDPGQNSQTIGNVVVVDPRNDTLYDFFERFQSTGDPKAAPRGASVGLIKSTDGGTTWSDAITVAAQTVANDTDPNNGARLRTGAGLPSIAVDPSSGQLYVVWEDARFTGGAVNQAVLSTSTDGGNTWSAPAVVSGTPSTVPAITATVAVGSAGTVAVTYYDFRDLTAGNTSTLPTNLFLRTSPAGGGNFGAETHVSGPFNYLVAPSAGGFFLGDYQGLVAAGGAFHPFFVQTTCTDNSCTSNRTDVFTGSF